MIRRTLCAILAAVTWFGLTIQFIVIVRNQGPNGTLLNASAIFLGYFTILTNLIAAIILTAFSVRRPVATIVSSISTAAVVYVIAVGVVYFLILRELWSPTGLQWLADVLLHYVTPIGYPLLWITTFPKYRLSWNHVWLWMIYPLAFAAMTAARGHLTSWYPYPFLNTDALGYPRVLLNVLILTAGFAVLGASVMWINRAIAGKSAAKPNSPASP